MALPKFIITDKNCLRLGDVNRHYQLLLPGERCLGGGLYEFDYVSNRLLLSWLSTDYGTPRWERIDTLKVPMEYRGMRIVYEKMGNWEHGFCVTDELKIEYI